MKKIFVLLFVFGIYTFISGNGYKGTLPDLTIKDVNFESMKPQKTIKNNVLPLDKLTIPVRQDVPIDKELVEYKDYINNVILQLNRLEEILNGDKSFKNFIAAANVLDLTTQNITAKFTNSRFSTTNTKLNSINHDVQEIKNYWIKIAKNAPYVSYYDTNGIYSGKSLNEQLNNFSKILDYAKRDITKQSELIK